MGDEYGEKRKIRGKIGKKWEKTSTWPVAEDEYGEKSKLEGKMGKWEKNGKGRYPISGGIFFFFFVNF